MEVDERQGTNSGAAGSGQPVDWREWHTAYDSAESPLARRLRLVQAEVRSALERAPDGPVKAISVCAGQGHDLIGVLADHPRRADVGARLVELDPENVRAARAAAAAAGLEGLEIVAGDASVTDAYAGAVPAGLVLLCGVFGNLSEEDVAHTIGQLDRLCAPGATVVWTRHRNPPDLAPRIRETFASRGFAEVAFADVKPFAVGANRLQVQPRPFQPGVKMFEFIGHRALWPHLPPARREALQALFRADCSLVELVEAMRAIPHGVPSEPTAESMLREACGTAAIKHLFLAGVLAQRFPASRPRIVHRVYRLDRARALALHGPAAAAAVPAAGMLDVHRYLTLAPSGTERGSLDVTLAGEPWDGHAPLAPVCGPGEDFACVSADPDAELRELEAGHCDAGVRSPFLAAFASGAPAPG